MWQTLPGAGSSGSVCPGALSVTQRDGGPAADSSEQDSGRLFGPVLTRRHRGGSPVLRLGSPAAPPALLLPRDGLPLRVQRSSSRCSPSRTPAARSPGVPSACCSPRPVFRCSRPSHSHPLRTPRQSPATGEGEPQTPQRRGQRCPPQPRAQRASCAPAPRLPPGLIRP